MTIEQDRHRSALLYTAARLVKSAAHATEWGHSKSAALILEAAEKLREAARAPVLRAKQVPAKDHRWRRNLAVAPKRPKGPQ